MNCYNNCPICGAQLIDKFDNDWACVKCPDRQSHYCVNFYVEIESYSYRASQESFSFGDYIIDICFGKTIIYKYISPEKRDGPWEHLLLLSLNYSIEFNRFNTEDKIKTLLTFS